MKKKLFMSVVLPAAMVFATSAFAGKQERIQWTDVPPAVQKTITDNAGSGKIEEIEKGTITKNVRILHFDSPQTVTVYEAEVEKPDGKEIEIKVGEDGKLMPAATTFATSAFAGKQERIQWKDVPPAVQKAITDHAGGGKIEEIEKETIVQNIRVLHFDSPKIVTVYEAEVEKPDGKEIEVKVGEDGKIVSAMTAYATPIFAGRQERIQRERIQWTDVPSAVQKTIIDHAGGGKIEEVEKETITKNVRILHFDSPKIVTVYEAEVEKPDGKEIEIKVGEDGKFIATK